MKANPSPYEYEEQHTFVQWCERQGLKLTSIPNNTYTKSISQKRMNTYTGLRPGFPDLVVLVPPHKAKDGMGRLLCIEMKRRVAGVVSDVQRDWHLALNGLGCPAIEAVVAHGADEAIDYVRSFLAHTDNAVF